MRPRTHAREDEVELVRSFEALANPVRLALLRELKSPKALADVRVVPPEAAADGALARQSIRRHLDRLLESRLVVAHESSTSTEYGLNHQGLFALAENVLDLSGLRPDVAPEIETAPAATRRGALDAGPSVVLVHGASIGQVFALAGAPLWRIGRHRDLEVPLDHDPFVSGEQARIEPAGLAHDLVDVASARNATTLNFRALPRGGRARLRQGDLIGAGRSLLLYRAS